MPIYRCPADPRITHAVSFTAVSEAGTDLRGALSLALAQAGCPVLTLSAETMSLEDVFLQLTETPAADPAPQADAAEADAPAPDAQNAAPAAEGAAPAQEPAAEPPAAEETAAEETVTAETTPAETAPAAEPPAAEADGPAQQDTPATPEPTQEKGEAPHGSDL